MNKIIVVALIGLMLVSCVSAVSVNYFILPNCGHCQKLLPFINQTYSRHLNINWNILDVTKGSYNVQGIPTIKINTNDKREITLVGSSEIPKYLECELNEMSTLYCPTTSYLNCTTNSYFIR